MDELFERLSKTPEDPALLAAVEARLADVNTPEFERAEMGLRAAEAVAGRQGLAWAEQVLAMIERWPAGSEALRVAALQETEARLWEVEPGAACLELLERAEALLRAGLDPNTPQSVLSLVALCFNRGARIRALGDHDTARDVEEEGMDLMRELAELAPAYRALELDWMMRWGDRMLAAGDRETALELHEAAFQGLEPLHADAMQRGNHLFRVGQSAHRSGDLDKALWAGAEAVTLAEQAWRDQPRDTSAAQLLGFALIKLAVYQQDEGSLEEALQTLARAESTWMAVLDRGPQAHEHLVTVQNNAAYVCYLAGASDRGIPWAERGLAALARWASDADADHGSWGRYQGVLRASCLELADGLQEAGDEGAVAGARALAGQVSALSGPPERAN